MKVKELMTILEHTDPEMEVIMFANGSLFPTLGTQEWTENCYTVLEIGGGWAPIYEGDV